MRKSLACGVTAAAALVTVTAPTHAYELRVSPGGAPVKWYDVEVAFDLAALEAGGRAAGLPAGAATAAANGALETWTRAGGPVLLADEGTGGARVAASIRLTDDIEDPGIDPDALALTHVTFDPDNGEIYRVEIVINAAAFRWSAGDACSGAYDLEATLAHEIGHALGLRHSRSPGATMHTHPQLCERDRRDLDGDDFAAIADLYGSTAPPENVAGAGCSAAGPGDATWLGVLGLALLLYLRNRMPGRPTSAARATGLARAGSPVPARMRLVRHADRV